MSGFSTSGGMGATTNDKAITRSRNQTAESIYGAPNRAIPNSDKGGVESIASSATSRHHQSRLGPIARLFSSSHRILTRHHSLTSDGQTVNEEAAARSRWRKTHSAVVHPHKASDLQQLPPRRFLSHHPRRSLEQRVWSINNCTATQSRHSKSHSVLTTTTTTTAATTGSRPGGSRQRKTAVYSRDFPVASAAVAADCGAGVAGIRSSTAATEFPSVENLIKMYATMLADRESEFADQKTRAKSEGE